MTRQLTEAEAESRRALRMPADPEPFEVFNSEGMAQVLLLCDHATSFIPQALDRLGLDDALLCRHIAWDIGIAEVTRSLSERLDAPAVLSGFSRLVIDPNRQTGLPSSIPEVSDDVPIPGNMNLASGDVEARIETFFRPYHGAISAQLDRMMARGEPPVVISMHSFTPVMDGVERPWKIGILWNKDWRLPKHLIERLRSYGLTVGDNEPYSGQDAHGFTQHVHADARGLANALIEVRQDLIDTHHGAREWAEILGNALSELLIDPNLYRIQHFE